MIGAAPNQTRRLRSDQPVARALFFASRSPNLASGAAPRRDKGQAREPPLVLPKPRTANRQIVAYCDVVEDTGERSVWCEIRTFSCRFAAGAAELSLVILEAEVFGICAMEVHKVGARHPPPVVYLYLAVTVVTWAGNWPLMKLALADVSPLQFVLLRLGGTIALLLPMLPAMRIPLLPARGERLTLAWVGLLQVAGFLIFSIIGLAIVPAGRAIVLAYTMALWAIPIGLWLWPEGYGRRQLAGAAVGFAGLVLFMNPGLVDWTNRRALAGNGLLLAAAICWALGSCLYRRTA